MGTKNQTNRPPMHRLVEMSEDGLRVIRRFIETRRGLDQNTEELLMLAVQHVDHLLCERAAEIRRRELAIIEVLKNISGHDSAEMHTIEDVLPAVVAEHDRLTRTNKGLLTRVEQLEEQIRDGQA